MNQEAKDKIRAMSKGDVPIARRRALYNQLGRRFRNPVGLKKGLLEKYTACINNQSERFRLLKEFLIDENLCKAQCFLLRNGTIPMGQLA